MDQTNSIKNKAKNINIFIISIGDEMRSGTRFTQHRSNSQYKGRVIVVVQYAYVLLLCIVFIPVVCLLTCVPPPDVHGIAC